MPTTFDSHAQELRAQLWQIARIASDDYPQLHEKRYQQYAEFCRNLIAYKSLNSFSTDEFLAFKKLILKLGSTILGAEPESEELNHFTWALLEATKKLTTLNEQLNRDIAVNFPSVRDFANAENFAKFLAVFKGAPADQEELNLLEAEAKGLVGLTPSSESRIEQVEEDNGAGVGVLLPSPERRSSSIDGYADSLLVVEDESQANEGAASLFTLGSAIPHPAARSSSIASAEEKTRDFDNKLKKALGVFNVQKDHQAQLGGCFAIENFGSREDLEGFLRLSWGDEGARVWLRNHDTSVKEIFALKKRENEALARLQEAIAEIDAVLVRLLGMSSTSPVYFESDAVMPSQFAPSASATNYGNFLSYANQIKLLARKTAQVAISCEVIFKALDSEKQRKMTRLEELELLYLEHTTSVAGLENLQTRKRPNSEEYQANNELLIQLNAKKADLENKIAKLNREAGQFKKNKWVDEFANYFRGVEEDVEKGILGLITSLSIELEKLPEFNHHLKIVRFFERVRVVSATAKAWGFVYIYDWLNFCDELDEFLEFVHQELQNCLSKERKAALRELLAEEESASARLSSPGLAASEVANAETPLAIVANIDEVIVSSSLDPSLGHDKGFLIQKKNSLLKARDLDIYLPLAELPSSRAQQKAPLFLFAESKFTETVGSVLAVDSTAHSDSVVLRRIQVETELKRILSEHPGCDSLYDETVVLGHAVPLLEFTSLPEKMSTELELWGLLRDLIAAGSKKPKPSPASGDVGVMGSGIDLGITLLTRYYKLTDYGSMARQLIKAIFRTLMVFESIYPDVSKVLLLSIPPFDLEKSFTESFSEDIGAAYICLMALMYYRAKRPNFKIPIFLLEKLPPDVQNCMRTWFNQEWSPRLVKSVIDELKVLIKRTFYDRYLSEASMSKEEADSAAVTAAVDFVSLLKPEEWDGWLTLSPAEQSDLDDMKMASLAVGTLSLKVYEAYANRLAECGRPALQTRLIKLQREWKTTEGQELDQRLKKFFEGYASGYRIVFKHHTGRVREFLETLSEKLYTPQELGGGEQGELRILLENVLNDIYWEKLYQNDPIDFLRGEFLARWIVAMHHVVSALQPQAAEPDAVRKASASSSLVSQAMLWQPPRVTGGALVVDNATRARSAAGEVQARPAAVASLGAAGGAGSASAVWVDGVSDAVDAAWPTAALSNGRRHAVP